MPMYMYQRITGLCRILDTETTGKLEFKNKMKNLCVALVRQLKLLKLLFPPPSLETTLGRTEASEIQSSLICPRCPTGYCF